MFALTVVALLVASAIAFDPNEVRTYEEMVACRDGVKLHTRIVMPKDYEGKTFTAIVDRSPYGYTDLEWISDLYMPAGFVAVGQDMRGTEKSEGNFTIWHGDADDSEDLGNWIVEQPWSNGKIMLFGASADGLAAFTTSYNKPSWLGSQYYVWTSALGYEVIYPNGALLENLVDRWIGGTVHEDEVDHCLNEIYSNEMETDWWEAIDMQTPTPKWDLVAANSGFWSGWYDIFLVGNLASYDGFNNKSPEEVRHQSLILVDPCGHCQDAAEYMDEDIIAGRTLLAFMQSYQVFGVRPVERTDVKNITFYVMSSADDAGRAAGQFWTSVEKWPAPFTTSYYLLGDGSISTVAAEDSDEIPFSRTYVYDPSDPAPTNGGANLFLDCGPLDQSEIDKRSDTLVYETPVLSEELIMTGAIDAYLWVSSDAIDTDFMVRISDVYPTGEARLIQDSAVRMRWRNGGLNPEYLTKGEIVQAHASLWNTSYVIAPGHSLRVSISSSNAPRFSVNRNNGLLLTDPSYPGENITATNTIYSSHQYASYIDLPIVTKTQLPELHDIRAQFTKAYPHMDPDMVLKHGPKFMEYLSKSRQGKL